MHVTKSQVKPDFAGVMEKRRGPPHSKTLARVLMAHGKREASRSAAPRAVHLLSVPSPALWRFGDAEMRTFARLTVADYLRRYTRNKSAATRFIETSRRRAASARPFTPAPSASVGAARPPKITGEIVK